ncbi:MAG: hypothetical protein RSP_04940 [Rhodanobacter sp.]
MKTLGSFLPVAKLGPIADAFATRVLARNDVPHEINGQPVAEDVNDREPRWFGTSDGKRIAGLLTVNGLAFGAPSLATPVLIALIPVLAIATTVLSILFASLLGPRMGMAAVVLGGSAILAVTAALKTAEGWGVALGCLLLGALIPLIATLGPSAVPGMNMVSGTFHSNLPLPIPVLVCVVVAVIFLAAFLLKGSIDAARVATLYILGFLLTLGVIRAMASFLPDWAAPGVWFLVGAGLPWVYTSWKWRLYQDECFNQDQYANGESGSKGLDYTMARQQQAENVMRDTSPVMTLGVATGTFTRAGDGLAPDKGKRLCMSEKDSSMNLAIFGRIGTRKTSHIRAWLTQWIRNGNGFLVLDEKDLPAELRGLKGYHLIEPGTRFAPLQGLNPTEQSVAIMGAGKGVDKKDDASSFFFVQAYTMWLNGAVITEALIDVEQQAIAGTNGTRRIHKHVAGTHDVIAHGVRGDKAMTVMLEGLEGYRRDNKGEQHMLERAIDYFRSTLPTMDPETKMNVFSTLLGKIDPMLSHRDLVEFAFTEESEGFDLADITRGGRYGVNLPEATYGLGGLVIGNLVKERVFKLLRERGSHWEKVPGQKRVALVADEAAGLVGQSDVAFLKVGRGFGATCVYSVQNADAYVHKLGSKPAAETFLDNFASVICMESSTYTYEVLSAKLGHTRKLVWKGHNGAVNFVRSLRYLADSALLDPNHPGAKRARVLLRRGAGRFKEQADMRFEKPDRKSLLPEIHEQMKVTPIQQFEWKEGPLLELPEWSSHLAPRGIAIAQVLRGEVKRRDVIKFESLREFPPDLLEQAPAPKVETPPAEESTRTPDDLQHADHKPARRSLLDLDKVNAAAYDVEPTTPATTTAERVKP